MFVNPLHGHLRVWVIVERAVDAGDAFHRLEDGADVVADKDDGTLAVDFLKQFIKFGLETLVDVSVRLVKNDHVRLGDDGTPQQGTLHLSAAELADGTPFKPLQPHACHHLLHTGMMSGREALQQALLPAQP